MEMPATHRIIRTAHGTLRARVLPMDSFGLGTQLDLFFRERECEPHSYVAEVNSRTGPRPIGLRGSRANANLD